MPLAMVIFGPLADFVKIEYILIVSGALFIAGSVFLINDKVIKNYNSDKTPVVQEETE